MAAIIPTVRNNISQILNRTIATNKATKAAQSEFTSSIESVGVQNAAKEFITLPSQTSFADKLFDEMSLHGLPDKLFNSHLDEHGDTIRNMLGIIYKEAQKEDIPKFEKVFREFEKADSKFTKDTKVSSELSFLFNKYGEAALDKHVKEYTQHCRDAWGYHHNATNTNITDEHIFQLDVMACKEVLNFHIKELSKPDQSWATLICSGAFFKDACSSLSKTLKHYDAPQVNQPSPEAPFKNIPVNNTSERPDVQKQDIGNPDVTIPAGNGHGPIHIHNTANGGNGTSNVNNNVPNNAPTSDIDFGIALLNTPDEELGNEKARLVEKFMDLYWGRSQNGGRDKFSDHVESVVQHVSHAIHIDTLPAPRALQTVESFISMPTPQMATVIDNSSQQVMGRAETTFATQQISSPEAGNKLKNAASQVAQALSGLLTEVDSSQEPKNIPQNTSPESMSHFDTKAFTHASAGSSNVLNSNQPDYLMSVDAGKELKSATSQVAQALSGLLNEVDSSQKPQNVLQSKQAGMVEELPIEEKPTKDTPNVGTIKNQTRMESQVQQQSARSESPLLQAKSSDSQSRVQQLVRKFEALNSNNLTRNDGAISRSSLNTTNAVNGALKSKGSNTEKLNVPPTKRAENKFKYEVNVNQNRVYTTTRTIDPFSRHSAHLNQTPRSVEQTSKEESELNDVAGSV